MILALLADPAALRTADEAVVFRSADEFRPIDAVTGGFTIPLRPRADGTRTTWRLSQSTLVVQRTFPRIMDASIALSGLMAIVPLTNPGFVANGFACDDRTVLLLRGSARSHFLEAQGGLTAIVCFDATALATPWPVREDSVAFVRLPRDAMQSIRASLRDTVRVRPDDDSTDLHAGLLETFDRAVAAGELAGGRGQLARMRYVEVVRRVDELLASRPTRPISNDEVADVIGLSGRTLHQAFSTIRGMGVHRYLRLRRLWSVRKQLLTARSQMHVGLIARAHGFSHMGEFAAAYREAFGEAPSVTAGSRPPQS